jgi:hypothetical protein
MTGCFTYFLSFSCLKGIGGGEGEFANFYLVFKGGAFPVFSYIPNKRYLV